jgi:hypothetical protein
LLLKLTVVAVGIFVVFILAVILFSVSTIKEQSSLEVARDKALAKAKTTEERSEIEQRFKELSEAQATSLAKAQAAEQEKERADAAALEQERLSIELIDSSQEAVKQSLKAPRTAKFPGIILERDEYKIYQKTNGSYQVSSWVDAQNSFGAMIRNHWLVELKKTGDQWQTVSVAVDD